MMDLLWLLPNPLPPGKELGDRDIAEGYPGWLISTDVTIQPFL
jgi:hypothetical protein